MRSVSLRLVDLQRCLIPIGYVGENEHTRVQIDALKMFEEYPNATVSMTVQPPEGESYPAVVTRDGNIIIWDVTDSDLIAEGQGEIQVSFSVGDVVAKSFIGRIRIDRSIIPTGEIPEPIDDWLTRAGAALTELDNLSADAVTLDAGSQATAEITEVEGHKNIHIGVPKGADAPTDTYAPKANPVFTGSISMGRKSGTTVGSNSVATGSNVTASSANSHAEGIDTQATGWAAHAEGAGTIANGDYSHAEGANARTTAAYAHAEGGSTTASGTYAHAEGSGTTASGGYGSHAEGSGTTASGSGAHAEGAGTTASGYNSHAEGQATVASGILSHAEGEQTIANHKAQHVFGTFNTADNSGAGIDSKGNYVEIVGNGTANNARSNARTLDWSGNEELAGDLKIGGAFSRGRKANTTVGTGSMAVGYNVEASAANTQALGASTKASGTQSHAEGGGTTASGTSAHAEGSGTTASGGAAHSEGSNTTASGSQAHAEGAGSTASGDGAHAEGSGTRATASNTHTEGGGTEATAPYAHAEGAGTHATGNTSHAEGGGTTASGSYSHAEGSGTIANHKDQHVFGMANVADPSEAEGTAHGTYIEIVGNGASANERSNARTLDWSGNEELAGELTLKKGTADEVDVAAELSRQNGAIAKKAEVKDSTEVGVDLDVADANGNVIVRLKDGNIRTKNFNSEDSSVMKNSTETTVDLDVSDNNGNVLMRLQNGHIKTKNFDSTNVGNMICYVSPSGLDTNSGDSTHPFKTIQHAIDGGYNRIMLAPGEYKNQKVNIENKHGISIVCNSNQTESNIFESHTRQARAKLDNSIDVTGLTAYNSIFRTALSVDSDSSYYKVFVSQTVDPVYDGAEYYGRVTTYNAILWEITDDILTCTRLVPKLTLVECEATAGSFFYDGDYLYVNPTSGSITGNTYKRLNDDTFTSITNGFYIYNSTDIYIEGMDVQFFPYYGFHANRVCDLVVRDCGFYFTCYGSAAEFHWCNGDLWECNAAKAGADGFGIATGGNTSFYNCNAVYCYDDGISHHDGSTGIIDGGIWTYCKKGGVTPSYGSHVTVKNVIATHNVYGIYFPQSGTRVTDGVQYMQNCLAVDNTTKDIKITGYDVVAHGCSYGTKEVDTGATLTEYNSTVIA